MRRALPVLVALGLVAAVLVPYLALGGASFEPTPVADPCATRDWRDPGDPAEVLEQIVLSALDGAACELGVTREEAEQAVRDGMLRAVDDAEESGAIGDTVAGFARRVVESVPPWLVLETLESLEFLLPD